MQEPEVTEDSAARYVEIPQRVNSYRYWFEQEIVRSEADLGQYVAPFIVRGETLEELQENWDQVQRELDDTSIIAPSFYDDLFSPYDTQDEEGEPEGPFERVYFASLEEQQRALSNTLSVATGMPLPRGPIGHKTIEDPHRINRPDRRIDRIVAVIDSDIAWANHRFRNPDGSTRIGWFWDMDADRFDSSGQIGREMSWFDIEAYLGDLSQPGFGEMQLYLKYQRDSYKRPTRALAPSQLGHGTAVLDAAVGGQDVVGDDFSTVIVGIQLPRFAVAQTHGYFLDVYIRLALDRVRSLAKAASAANPGHARPEVLVNISVGGSAGRHDGLNPVERAMDERIARGHFKAIFLPAGNGFATRTHASLRASELAAAGDLVWRVVPDDGTASFVEIWLPDDRNDPVSLDVSLPNGVALSLRPRDIEPWRFYRFLAPDGDLLGGVVVLRSVARDPAGQNRNRRWMLIASRATALRRARAGIGWKGRPDLAGDWKIRLRNGSLNDIDLVEIYLARDDQIFRLPTKARQAFFPEHGPANGHVTEAGTLSDLASGLLTTVCAAHWASDRMMTPYSGRGTARDDSVADRDVVPCASHFADRSEVCRGVAASGFFSGTMRPLSGTSVAAPRVLRQFLTNQIPAGAGSVRERVRDKAATDEAAQAQVTNPVKERVNSTFLDYGCGRLTDRIFKPFAPFSTDWAPRRRRSIR